MALFDDIKKLGAGLWGAATGAQPGPGAPVEAAPLDGGGDLSDPLRWLTAERVRQLTGVPVGHPREISTPETYGVAFEGADARGDFRFELHALEEDAVARYGGSPSRWIDARVGALAYREIPTFGDRCVAAHDDAGRSWCYVWVADSAMMAAAVTPGVSAEAECERLLRAVYDWPSS